MVGIWQYQNRSRCTIVKIQNKHNFIRIVEKFYVFSNPISDSSRLWVLGVCGALRRLTLNGTSASDTIDYRTRVAAALPMLVYLDDRPLHTDIDCKHFVSIKVFEETREKKIAHSYFHLKQMIQTEFMKSPVQIARWKVKLKLCRH